MFLCVCVMLLSKKGYYSMSPYDDGYVSFMYSFYFLSSLRFLPLILLVPRSVSSSFSFSSSTSSYLPLLDYRYTFLGLPFNSTFPAISLWFLLDCPSFKGCLALFVVRKTPFVRALVKQNRNVSFKAYLIIKYFVLKDRRHCSFSQYSLLTVCQSSF